MSGKDEKGNVEEINGKVESTTVKLRMNLPHQGNLSI